MSKLTEQERHDIIINCKPPANFMDAVNKAMSGDTTDLAEILSVVGEGYNFAMNNFPKGTK